MKILELSRNVQLENNYNHGYGGVMRHDETALLKLL